MVEASLHPFLSRAILGFVVVIMTFGSFIGSSGVEFEEETILFLKD